MKKTLSAIVLGIAVLMAPGCGTITTGGEHVGIVTAMEKTGLVWKTWDVYVKTDATSSQEDTYCVTDDDVVASLKKFNVSREKVVLKYHSELLVAPWRCEGKTIIDSVSMAQ